MSWEAKELDGINLKDKRLDKRAKKILGSFSSQPSNSIPTACGGWSETCAAYNFLDNKKVTQEKVLEPHYQSTKKRMAQHKTVLCIEDTTELDYTSQPQLKGLGPLTYEDQNGLYLHPTIAVTPDRLCLGVLNTLMWSRDPATYGKKSKRREKALEEKESLRWIEGYRNVCKIAKGMRKTRCVYMSDREGDIYELYLEGYLQNYLADYLVRICRDRKTEDDKISKALIYAPKLGELTFDLPASHRTRAGQTVTQTLKSVRVMLRPPERAHSDLEATEVTVIMAQEENPPCGEEPVTWMFMTNLELETPEDIIEKVQWYLCRWQIEIYFRILKSGCQIEKLQLEHASRLQPALALYMIVAWRVLYLTMLGRECPDLPCDIVFDTKEWQAIYIVSEKQAPPEEVPPLNEIIAMLASFGGFLGRKGDGEPGPQSIWIGLQRARDFALAVEATKALQTT